MQPDACGHNRGGQMNTIDNQNKITRIKTEASRLMHLHYCQNDVDSVIATFGSVMSWFGAGEDQYAVGRDEVTSYFRRFRGAIAKCTISDEEYDVMEAAPEMCIRDRGRTVLYTS